jgi:hypothetical protein
MELSETLVAVIIGGTFGFLGALTGIFANVWLDTRRAHRERAISAYVGGRGSSRMDYIHMTPAVR